MTETISKEEIAPLIEKKIDKLITEQRELTKSILEKQERDKSEIIAAIFLEHKKTRERIGYQAMLFKTLEDKLDDIKFEENTGVSSKVEISVGTEIFGTGAKLVIDCDLAKLSYKEMLQAALNHPAISKHRDKIEKKLQKFIS